MLSLSDPRWAEFNGNYTDGTRVAGLLDHAHAEEDFWSWYENLHQELCHQYTVSAAAYPAAPHLVALARERPLERKFILVLLGVCHAFSDPRLENPLPADIRQSWHLSALEALPLLLEIFTQQQTNISDTHHLLVALAAFTGHPTLAQALEFLDYKTD